MKIKLTEINKNNDFGFSKKENRFVVVDNDGKIIDDANGYGFKTALKAKKAMWYKFCGGKEKIQKQKTMKAQYFKEHPGLEKFLENLYEDNVKELCRGEFDDTDILEAVKEEFGIGIPTEYLTLD